MTAVLLLSAPAGAEEGGCFRIDKHGDVYPICFDPGNRLALTADLQPVAGDYRFGGEIAWRHQVKTRDAEVTWRFEHVFLESAFGQEQVDAVVYAGRMTRHSRDGHLVLPTTPPRSLFLPFDVGAEAEIGRLSYAPGAEVVHVQAVRAVALVDLARSEDFRRRFTIGTAVRWDFDVADDASRLGVHLVAPFSIGQLELHGESADGLWVGALRAEAGGIWSTSNGWGRRLAAEASAERILVAVNDLPLSIYAAASWADPGAAVVTVGLRFALVSPPPLARP